jgi:hypothetical protein
MYVKRRHFLFLAIGLVALNSFFWLAGSGFALPKAIVNQFFGSRMIRAEVLLQAPGGPQDWRIDRGVITAIALPNITLREADGTSVTLQVNSTARVQGPPRFYNVTRLKRGLRVVIYHQANLPSDLVQVEGVG